MTLTRKQLELAIAGGTATELDFEGFAPADVFDIKRALPSVQRFSSAIKAHDPEAKTVEMIFNVQVVDRMGDLVISNPPDAAKWGGEGWDLTYWELGGSPYLHVHNHHLVVGRVLSTKVQKVAVPKADHKSGKAWALTGIVQFFDSAKLPFSEADYLLATEGIGNSSVGFMPKMYVWVEDEKERQKLGLGKWGAVLPWSEMLEISFAPVPANQVSNLLTAPGDAEKAVDQALSQFVDEGKLSKALAADYKRMRPLGPRDAEERTAARVRGFIDVAQLRGWQAPEGVTLECAGGVCQPVRSWGTLQVGSPAEPNVLDVSCGCSASTELTELRGYQEQVRDLLGLADTECSLDAIRGLLDQAETLSVVQQVEALTSNLAALSDKAQEVGGMVRGEGGAGGPTGDSPTPDLKTPSEDNSIDALARNVECLLLRFADLSKAVTQRDAPGNPPGGGVSSGEKLSNAVPATGGESSTAEPAAAGHETSFDLSQVEDITSRLS